MKSVSTCAVLTGDLIKSRQAPHATVDAAFTVLRTAAIDFGIDNDVDLRFTRFRGDGWQVILTRAELVLDAMLFLVARLRSISFTIETRISAGIGIVSSIGTTDLADANGTAFFIAGDQLEKMSGKHRLAIAGSGIGLTQAAIVDLAAFITTRWTRTQAEAVAMSLQSRFSNHEAIAEALGITRQAVQNRLAGAGLIYLNTALQAMRTHGYTDRPKETQ